MYTDNIKGKKQLEQSSAKKRKIDEECKDGHSSKKVMETVSDSEDSVDEAVDKEQSNGKPEVKSNENLEKSSDAVVQRTPAQFDKKEFIKEKFLVDMPEDFYLFWDFCKQLKGDNPKNALASVGLILVGPYDVLANKFTNIVERSPEEYLIHWRYYYDPPEFQTVIKGNDSTGYHIGYFRDEPNALPVFLASNHAKKNGEFNCVGENIFAAVK